MSDTFHKLSKLLNHRVGQNIALAKYTTLKVGGPADYFFEAKTQEDLIEAIKASRLLQLSLFVLGGGTNILIGDKGIRGLVVKNNTDKIAIRGIRGSRKDGSSSGHVFVEADSGVVMNKLIRYTIEEGLGGLEMQLGLPGTVGGAVYMNSKWTHPVGYVGDVVYQATIIKKNNETVVVPKSYFQFAYDSSCIQQTGDIVLSVVFSLVSGSRDELWKIANESISYRRSTQPQGVASPGCTFKNISPAQAVSIPTPNHTTSAGFLIDHAGLKGATQGGVQISPVHANFMVNTGNATASDVVKLIERARDQVKQQYGVVLEEEIVRVGEF